MEGNKIRPFKLKQKTAQEEIAEQNKYLDEQMTEEWIPESTKEKMSSFATTSLSILLVGWLVALTYGITNKCSEASEETTIKTQKNLLHTFRETPAPYILTKQDSIDIQRALHPDSLAQEEGELIKLMK